jgi:hypothetical protein
VKEIARIAAKVNERMENMIVEDEDLRRYILSSLIKESSRRLK